MALNFDYYGKQDGQTAAARIAEATSYFAQRLHETAWSDASDADREKALIAARGIIDGLNYKGNKHSVYTLLQANPSAAQERDQGGRGQPAIGVSRGAQTRKSPRPSASPSTRSPTPCWTAKTRSWNWRTWPSARWATGQ